jgi:hypothetical protein
MGTPGLRVNEKSKHAVRIVADLKWEIYVRASPAKLRRQDADNCVVLAEQLQSFA